MKTKLKTFIASFFCFFVIFSSVVEGKAQNFGYPKGFAVQGETIPQIIIPEGLKESAPKKSSYKPSEEDLESGYVLFQNNYLDLLNYNATPKSDSKPVELKAFISLGEYEPLTFAIYALKNLENVKIKVSDLVNSKGDVISKNNMDVRIVKYCPRKGHNKTYSLKPLILAKEESIYIQKGATGQFWLTIYIPPDSRAGVYNSDIVFKPVNAPAKTLKLKVEVIPIKLTSPGITYGIYYNIDDRWKGFYPGNIRKHFTDIKEHGLNSVTIYACVAIDIDKNGFRKFNFSKDAHYSPWSLEEAMSSYIECGLRGPVPFLGTWYPLTGEIGRKTKFKEYSGEFDNIYIDAVKAMEKHRKARNWPEFLYSTQDEPANKKEKLKRAKHYLRLIKNYMPRVKTYSTLNGLEKGVDDDKILNPWLDVRCYAYFNEEMIKDTIDSNDEFWIYNGGSLGLYPLFDRFFYGFYGVKSRAKGIYQWVYHWPSSLGVSPYEELTQERQGYYYTYPTPDGPVPTPAWEAIREGIDDAKYLYTLKLLIKYAKKSGDFRLIKEAKYAEKDIEQILQQININYDRPKASAHAIFGYAPFRNLEKLNSWRRTLADKILLINNLLKKENITVEEIQ